MWFPSSTDEEDWIDTEGGEGGMWGVKGIVGEEVNSYGGRRYELEVRWDRWERTDGTSTTWEVDQDGLASTWNRTQHIKRTRLAAQSRDVDLAPYGLDLCNTNTILISRAYDEKLGHQQELLGLYLKEDWDTVHGMTEEDAKARRRVPAPSSRSFSRASARHDPPVLPRSSSSSQASSSSRQRPFRPVSSRIARSAPTGNAPVDELAQGRALARRWTVAARHAGAASVNIVNDVDNDEMPDIVDTFVYSERACIYDVDIHRMQQPDCLVTCDCAVCDDPQTCRCQDPSELRDEFGTPEFAYTGDLNYTPTQGRFAFNLPPGVEVIECNKGCTCPDTCRNRVAQRPRDVPIEVFKTRNRGWGARATIPLQRGKVVGLYVGKLIRRSTARELPAGRGDYCFDLDVREYQEDEQDSEDHKYSVDSYAIGNWSRFVNHSCNPNMRVFPVVYDTIPEMNTPYLAFAAIRDIAARTELTVDYDPKLASTRRKGKGKKTAAAPTSGKVCNCGEQACRGRIAE